MTTLAEVLTEPAASADIEGPYRYSLTRVWNPLGQRCLWVMLNPSKADDKINDPTASRCVSFAKSWSFGSIEIVNLFALISTEPRELMRVADPVGPRNDEAIKLAAGRSNMIVLAWGASGGLLHRDTEVLRLLMNYELMALRRIRSGAPEHPLYLPGHLKPVPFMRAPRNDA